RHDRARAAIVALPFGVLALGSPDVVFDPPVRVLEDAAHALAMGSAIRVALLFRDRFWTALRADDGTSAHDASFIHTTSARLPVWWTQYPREVPLLVGWAGGPRAHELSGLDDAALREVALDVLSSQLSLERARLDADLTGFWRSHWDTDP